MSFVRLTRVIIAVAAAACVHAARPVPAPVFIDGVWNVRIDVDSVPTRRLALNPVVGTIDFAKNRYAIDFWRSISRRLPNGAVVAPLPRSDDSQPRHYRITLGDTSSMEEKIVLVGRQVGRDSIVGTWSETILCCAAGGRFSLWRQGAVVR